MPQKIPLLILAPIQEGYRTAVAAIYDMVYAPDQATRDAAIAKDGPRFRGVLTIGTIGLTEAEIRAMPALEIICALGVGVENIDIAAARTRGIMVANGAGTNAASVADHAFGLLISAVRGIVTLDHMVRSGGFRDTLPDHIPAVSGKRIGIAGLGMIGRQLVKRASGFDMEIGYCSRSRRDDVDFAYFEDVMGLARWCDFLVVTIPGGQATRHLINAAVLEALGPRGVLVNVARGSVVDTEALAASLRSGGIAAAGLDVYESEPLRPESLVDLPNVVLTPHVGGRSPEAMQASFDRFLANIGGHFARRGVVSPV
ncbi:MAG: 2-hydroxyacid dehydrogenase [Paralcaligenes sp.]